MEHRKVLGKVSYGKPYLVCAKRICTFAIQIPKVPRYLTYLTYLT